MATKKHKKRGLGSSSGEHTRRALNALDLAEGALSRAKGEGCKAVIRASAHLGAAGAHMSSTDLAEETPKRADRFRAATSRRDALAKRYCSCSRGAMTPAARNARRRAKAAR